ncbi:unnamed protein product [Phaedon cochleariae]|uniref:F-box domain-containing protein n=1 Tax=Phaedon cochleariae TaxID=80249 RepID=A0A9P0DLV4_PHACE|nr:unnamed protein product [Phaedon cochleariae]
MDLEETTNGEGPPKKKSKSCMEKGLGSLPKHILLKILEYLDLESMANCSKVCSTFYNLSKDSSLYKKVVLKYSMTPNFLESLVSKVAHPSEVIIEYKHHDQYDHQAEKEDHCTTFNIFVERLLRKCGEYITSLKIENCHVEQILLLIGECFNLQSLILYRCKSSFTSLLSLASLSNISFTSCHFPQKIVSELIKTNKDLNYLYLSNNVNVNANEICEIMSLHNAHMKEIHFSERKRVKSKSLRTLARLAHLQKLKLVSGPGFDCDPDDSLELLAAGCLHLETLSIHGWKEVNDDNFIPALRMLVNLKNLELRDTNVTIKSCREAALTLPLLETLDVFHCHRIKKRQLIQLGRDFEEINIPLD